MIATEDLANNTQIFGRYEFFGSEPWAAVPILVILGIGTVVGTLGNVLILTAVATRKNLHNIESIFIVNLACSDLYVTAIADPMSIVGKLEGADFFDRRPGLCRAIGSLCTMSCIASLMTIAAMSCNRYVFIVHNSYYKTIFKKRNCIIMCFGFYCVGLLLVLLNLADVGDHSFDHKSLECIWDRMATYPFTVVFSIVLVWIPIVVVGISYIRMYLYVKRVRGRVHQARAVASSEVRPQNFNLARTLFIIYIVFSICWIPYALILVADANDEYHHLLHVYIVVFAHLHPSINWLVYYVTNRKFHNAFIEILHLHTCAKQNNESSTSSQGPLSHTLKPSNGSANGHRLNISK